MSSAERAFGCALNQSTLAGRLEVDNNAFIAVRAAIFAQFTGGAMIRKTPSCEIFNAASLRVVCLNVETQHVVEVVKLGAKTATIRQQWSNTEAVALVRVVLMRGKQLRSAISVVRITRVIFDLIVQRKVGGNFRLLFAAQSGVVWINQLPDLPVAINDAQMHVLVCGRFDQTQVDAIVLDVLDVVGPRRRISVRVVHIGSHRYIGHAARKSAVDKDVDMCGTNVGVYGFQALGVNDFFAAHLTVGAKLADSLELVAAELFALAESIPRTGAFVSFKLFRIQSAHLGTASCYLDKSAVVIDDACAMRGVVDAR
mmetsp:Transcript_3589/g.9973  ORF Transcript_3589/g.9973 Transcript_3589/m.9973 type:complete len:313 (-) Transcript_3589:242-1180(-)